MAKLSSCYPLCPLIDRSPVGVTSDSVPGCAIVTLGKNIVIRYKLADQKQASSWSSKDKLTAPVLYDVVGKQYVAVFNNSIIRVWDSAEVDLNKVKKLKFDQSIHSIVSRSGQQSEPVVVFKNGAAVSLSMALSDRKKIWQGPLSPELSIKDCFFLKLEGSDCIAVIAPNDKNQTVLHIVEVDNINSSPMRLLMERPGKKLLGQTTMQTDGSVSLLTLWSDGQLFTLLLSKTPSQRDSVGFLLYSVKAVSTKNVVAMTQISNNHLAIYGADPSEEGAMLAILNTQFMLVQAHQHYKLFSGSSNLWTIETNLLLVVGHSLAVVPFLLDTERLCALIGSHKPIQSLHVKGHEVEQILEMDTVSWDDEESVKELQHKSRTHSEVFDINKYKNSPEDVAKLVAQGYSQAMVCEKLIPHLLEECNIPMLLWLLRNLPDFPESALVRVLAFCLDNPMNSSNNSKVDFENGIDVDTEIDGEDSRDSQNTLVELSVTQRNLLDVIIRTPFSEATLIPYLRSFLNLPHCLALLQYVAQSLPQTRNMAHVEALMRWAAVLLDSHYQQLLLSKDECVSSTVLALKELVESQVPILFTSCTICLEFGSPNNFNSMRVFVESLTVHPYEERFCLISLSLRGTDLFCTEFV